ncbi:hypothetical protein [Paracoccus sp. (in: a-proteobacteria)]|uniref:hypothetical protein n=1 Tax=Paracoccus sp. TaxID=267 RepID=UPI00405865DD
MTTEPQFKLGDLVTVKGSPEQQMVIKNLRVLDEEADVIWIDLMGNLQKERLPYWTIEKATQAAEKKTGTPEETKETESGAT